MSEPEEVPTVRRMEIEDLPLVMAIDALSLPKPWTESIWRGELESPFGLYLVLEERRGADRFISGQIGVRHVLGELHVTTIAVHPERRRRGYARALLGVPLATFPDARAVHLEVRPSNEPARALYDSLGFVVTGRRRRYYGDEDALLMTLCLEDRRRL
ncbi:MAG TPA: GNAT family N-acetyltransferase [Rubrobacteraceae bacterium]|nr:GNAT family N-acetyltransferase [Rubrobacteraceae bacterium]